MKIKAFSPAVPQGCVRRHSAISGLLLSLIGCSLQPAIVAGATPVAVSVTPTAFSLSAGTSRQIAATVTGTANTAVTWSLQPALGTITTTGLYVAPAAVANATTVVVTARSAADTTKTAASTVTVTPGITPISMTMGSAGLTALLYQGQNFLYQPNVAPALVHVTQTDPGGSAISPSRTPVSVVTSPATNTVVQTYAWGVVSTAYQGLASKLRITVTVTNTSTNKTLTHLWMYPLGIQLPATPSNLGGGPACGFNQDAPTVAFWNFGTGTLAFVNEDVVKPLGAGFWPATSPAANKWYVSLDIDNGQSVSKNFPVLDRPIPPGASDQYVVSIRFGSPVDTSQTLAGDIFSLYRTTFPAQIVPPSKNRPIAALNATSKHRPAYSTNPRGWFNDPTIDVTTSAGIAAFHSKLLKWADGAVTEMQRVGAQGGILWDLEGQETDVAYVGDPTQIETIAPEMVGVLDAFVARFTSAGLRVGFTLRPQVYTQQAGFLNVSGSSVVWAGGTKFSPGWAAGPNVSTEIVIAGNNYQIQSVQSPTAMTLSAPAGTGTAVPFIVASQTNVADPGAVLNAKIQYVTKRFGPLANLFYVDSNLAWDGTITAASYFQKLLNANPNAMIFPEWEATRHYAYTIPYNNSLSGFFAPPASTMAVYPNAISLIKVNDPAAAASPQQLLGAARAGNILLFDGWYRHAANDLVQSIYAQLP